MGRDISGSLRKLTLAGIPFNVISDSNITEMSEFKNESISTSGVNIRKIIKQSSVREGVAISCNASERELLEKLSKSTKDIAINYETADGSVYRTTGWIEFESRETEDNKATLKLHPRRSWTPFIAS